MKGKHKRQVEQNPKCEHSKWRQKTPLRGIEITFDWLALVLLPSLIWCVTLFHFFGVSHFFTNLVCHTLCRNHKSGHVSSQPEACHSIRVWSRHLCSLLHLCLPSNYQNAPSCYSVAKMTECHILETKRAIRDPLVSKPPEKILKQICKKLRNCKMSTSNKCLNSQILGLVGFFQKFTKHHGRGIFSESPG